MYVLSLLPVDGAKNSFCGMQLLMSEIEGWHEITMHTDACLLMMNQAFKESVETILAS